MRISWEEYALRLAKVAALRSEDLHRKVGAVALSKFDHSIISIGYNGAPKGINIDWTNREERLSKVIHAEVNCLRYCKPNEVGLIAVTTLPCGPCLTNIASYGIKKIVYGELYERDSRALELAKEFGIELLHIDLNDEK